MTAPPFPLDADTGKARLADLTALLHACVEAGASVNFVNPFTRQEAEAYWRGQVLGAVASGLRDLFAVERGGRIVGSVQLDRDMPPNGRHRAAVTKLLVHPDARRQGLATALMDALEARALQQGRTLLTLDTRTGDPAARLYRARGYRAVGEIPGYCRDPFDRGLDPTTILYRQLTG
ncbi:GNAT family N-acetyltransferase [Rhodovibrio sodomensis]|uniref:GNAT family N-acetyltransferase n=1 Tax=Rhodovibrio sodomensis TaxID=1088 RepID=A0ABS1DJY8_9PROT|nr:N-acetyltransferase [Rhodovibrio sodomensis]MBK1670782.1 GNAT family N-acetyltransferase [Rhodovibrio sodomensis]